MRQILLSVLLSACTLTTLSLAPRAGDGETYARLAGAAIAGGGAYQFLETLTDSIGPRLTGTDGTRAAAELLLSTFRAAGLENVHAEQYPLQSRWRRGPADVRVVSPVSRVLVVQSFGWTPGTGATIESPLVDIGAVISTTNVTAQHGAIVLADFPGDRQQPGYVTRAQTARQLASAGATALLIPSTKPNRLLDIGCFGNYPAAALPMLSIAAEDALLLRRLLSRGSVRLSAQIQNTLDRSPTVERNIIADWRGTSLADRIILVGAHFDSWDTATGANDDGAGVAVVVNVARLLQSLDIRARRTIRFALFSGEEQAILGSHAYVDAHQADLDRIDAVVIMDEGAGAPRGFKLHGRIDLEGPLRRILQPLVPLDAAGLSQEASFDQDHGYFLAAGLPALTLWVQPGEYDIHHHSITDTLDKIDKRTLAMDSAVMATAVVALANAEGIGRRLAPAERTELLRRTTLDRSIDVLDEAIRTATRQ